MNKRNLQRAASVIFAASVGLGCTVTSSEPSPEQRPVAEQVSGTRIAPTPAKSPSLPEGWTDLGFEVAGKSLHVHTPANHRIDAGDWGTAVYADMEDYPFYYSIRHHEKQPALNAFEARADWQQRDTPDGFAAERREEDGTSWAYVVYHSKTGLSCHTGLSQSDGVSAGLITKAKSVCDSMR